MTSSSTTAITRPPTTQPTRRPHRRAGRPSRPPSRRPLRAARAGRTPSRPPRPSRARRRPPTSAPGARPDVPVVNGYCSVEELRGQLKDVGSKVDTALLERAVSAASRAVDQYCGRRFWQDPAPVARLYNPLDVYCALVDDISTRTGLVVQTDNAGDASYTTTLGVNDFRLEPLNADQYGSAYAWTRIV